MQRGSRKRRLPAKGGKARQRQRPPQSSTATAASAATAATAAAATSNAPRRRTWRRTWVEELYQVVTAEKFATWSNNGTVVSLSEVEWEDIVLPSMELSRNFRTFRHDLLNHGECRRPLQREERERGRERERAEEQKTAWYACVCVCVCVHVPRTRGKEGGEDGDEAGWGVRVGSRSLFGTRGPGVARGGGEGHVSFTPLHL